MTNKYTVFAIRADDGKIFEDSCQAFVWIRKRQKSPNERVILHDINPDVTPKIMYLESFSKILIKQGDRITWQWDGKIARYV